MKKLKYCLYNCIILMFFVIGFFNVKEHLSEEFLIGYVLCIWIFLKTVHQDVLSVYFSGVEHKRKAKEVIEIKVNNRF